MIQLPQLSSRTIWITAAALVAIIVFVVAWSVSDMGSIGLYTAEDPQSIQNEITDGTRNTVPLDQIVSGGPPRDGIPSVDEPRFVSVQEAEQFLQKSNQVIVVSINGEVKVYPLEILVWHEIVNDEVGGVPVAVTTAHFVSPPRFLSAQ